MTATAMMSNREMLKLRRPNFPVLVIDDDPVFQSLLQHFLDESGYELTICDSAENGLILLEQHKFELILCDWNLPGMNGLDLCQHVREFEDSYHYLIMMTSKTTDADMVQGFYAGADDYIRKGARKMEIIARLDAGLRVLVQQGELVKQRHEIERQAITDPLTGCFNRRHLIDVGSREMKRAQRYRQPLSVVMCDIDHFKQVNDQYGHPCGDAVLQAVAEVLMRSIRQDVDVVSRYGGEEFSIVLPNTIPEQAFQVAEKLRKNAEKLTVTWQDKALAVTLSFGVASTQSSETKDFDSLIAQADLCLYQSKRDGRNRTTLS